MDDSPVEPVAAVDAVTQAASPAPIAAPSSVAAQPPVAAADDIELDTAVTRAELEAPATTAPGLTANQADLHDAAVHGDPIARAIEHARAAGVTERAQQLGGAAAVAASGLATPAPERAESPRREDRVHDPLAPVSGISDEDDAGRDEEHRRAAELPDETDGAS